jgi:hypothetical protein
LDELSALDGIQEEIRNFGKLHGSPSVTGTGRCLLLDNQRPRRRLLDAAGRTIRPINIAGSNHLLLVRASASLAVIIMLNAMIKGYMLGKSGAAD